MLCKELLNLGTVGVDLALEHAQHSHARQSQATLGTGKGLAGDEPGGMRKDFHPLFIGLGSRQVLSVEELLPLAFASRYQSLRTPDTVELGWTQRGENEPEVGAWKEGLRGGEFLAEINEHCIVGRRAQAMEPHG